MSEVKSNASILRELVWLDIQKNPGSTLLEIEKRLGKTSLSSYVLALLEQGLLRREGKLKMCSNFLGSVKFYVYFTTTDTYSWKDRRGAKKGVQPKPQSKPRVQVSGKLSTAPALTPTGETDRLIKMILDLPVAQALAIRRKLNEVFV